MSIKIYNTLTKKKEIFYPIEKKKVKIYVCGPTVYDLCHIGHARSAIFFDVVVKYLKKIGYKVIYVRNFTDIDDKIIFRSNELGIHFKSLSDHYIKLFNKDMFFLKTDKPKHQPRVTKYIKYIINFIKILIEKKVAYENNGNVYFSIDKCNSYGKLSGRKKKDLVYNLKKEINKEKKSIFDFTLWKKKKAYEPFWSSPWGYGRPGWHIECSAIIKNILGSTIDIHAGGEDLIFPHHENEKIQSEICNEKDLAKYWMHNGLVNIDNTKMSKSLGNWRSVKHLSKKYNPETIRFFLLSNHYRKPLNFSEHNLESSNQAVTRLHKNIKKILIKLDKKIVTIYKLSNFKGEIWNSFCNAMNNDFNTAKSISLLFRASRKIKLLIDKIKNYKLTTNKKNIICKKVKEIILIGEILGIINTEFDKVIQEKENKKIKHIDKAKIKSLIHLRNKARINGLWDKADKIRNILEKKNVVIQDTTNGTRWKLKN